VTLAQENDETQKIDVTITKVDWGSTSPVEREAFSMSMLTLELTSQAKKISHAVSKGRFSTLLTCLVITGALMWFNVDPGTILGVTLGIQMLLLGMSQLFEYGAEVLFKRSEKATHELVEKLAKRHPLKEGSEDLFIL
jgi:hypothetical protein